MTHKYPNGREDTSSGRSTEFLSKGFEILVDQLHADVVENESNVHFDAVIIGSGYGGSVAAVELSKSIIQSTGVAAKVCVLERGKERLPGSFPDSISTIPNDFRLYRNNLTDPETNLPSVQGNKSGLFDIRIGDGTATLLANGLGGGSLINAGVMLEPSKSLLSEKEWPKNIAKDPMLNELFNEAKFMLGSLTNSDGEKPENNTIERANRQYEKFNALKSLAPSEYTVESVPITVKLSESDSDQAVKTDNCISCGDCFSGCNYNAKKSLDTNLLAQAAINGVSIYCSATVLDFEKLNNDTWQLNVIHTDDRQQRRIKKTMTIRCSKLIVAAGTLGSTELLMRSEKKSNGSLTFSSHLGQRFSGNGDMLANITNRTHRVNSIASEYQSPAKRTVGPTITGMIDLRGTECGEVAIQELAVPAVLHRLISEAAAFTQTIDAITRPDKAKQKYSDDFCTLAPCGPLGKEDEPNRGEGLNWNDGSETDHISVLALMGIDNKFGQLQLPTIAEEGNTSYESIPQGAINITFGSQKNDLTDTKQGSIDEGLDSTDASNTDKTVANESFYQKNMSLLKDMVGKTDKTAWVHANPLWKPLGTSLEKLFKVSLPGTHITVHPLGGCSMGENSLQGVVNEYGQVFDHAADDHTVLHNGLVVLDGSILPSPAGINPALTITTLSLRAIRHLKNSWQWPDSTGTDNTSFQKPIVRPYFQKKDPYAPINKRPTSIELVERLVGVMTFDLNHGLKKYVVELRLRSEPFNINEFTRFKKRAIPLLENSSHDLSFLLPERSYIRIFDLEDWNKHHDSKSIFQDRKSNEHWAIDKRKLHDRYDDFLNNLALFSAPLSGQITMLEETPIGYHKRLFYGVSAWIINRGIKDIWQSFVLEVSDDKEKGFTTTIKWYFATTINKLSAIAFYFKPETIAAFSNSGRERRLNYELTIGEAIGKRGATHASANGNLIDPSLLTGKFISGYKSFKYLRGSNPWRQLMDVSITNFPIQKKGTKANLSVDPEFFSRMKVPLLHIVDEDNAVDGYADLLTLYLHTFRIFLLQQLWTLRKPDTAPQSKFIHASGKQQEDKTAENRLPPVLNTEITGKRYPLDLNENNIYFSHKPPIEAFLTRYNTSQSSSLPPIICIHGYSASGTTFAHHTLYGGIGKKGGLAIYLANNNRDVWVLDMRSSCAAAGRNSPWTFEDMAFTDIPKAISKVCEVTGHEQVDIVAHCMGAVMFSMAMLGPGDSKSTISERQDSSDYKTISPYVRNIALSQAGPYLQFTAANTLRAYFLSYFRKLLPVKGYEFNPREPNSPDSVIFDRLLNTLPYPDTTEFKRENPIFRNAYWVRARHRMDALYGRTFSLKNISRTTLKHIDDFFGPFSFHTLEQTLWISNRKQMSGWAGHGYHMKQHNFVENWQQQTLWIHGRENGLIDPKSPTLMALLCDEQGLSNFSFEIIDDMGHQDCLIGKQCERPYRLILEHLT